MNREKLPPFIHNYDSVNMIIFDLFAALIPLIIIAVIQHGLRVLVMCILSAISAFLVETLGNFIKLRFKPASFRVAILGVCSTLLCPVTVPVYLPAIGVAFSVLFVRVLLIGDLKKLFMSPAIAWLFLLSVWPQQMMSYPVVIGFNSLPVFQNVTSYQSGWGLSQYLQFGEKPPFRMLDILVGRYPGGMGTTCVAVILLITVYFLFRKSVAWQVPLSMIFTVAVFAIIFNRTNANVFYSIIYELSASSFIYVAIFIAGDLINAPKLPLSRILFGVLLGITTMLLRYFGLFEHAVAFALVFINLISGLLDRVGIYFRIKMAQRHRAN